MRKPIIIAALAFTATVILLIFSHSTGFQPVMRMPSFDEVRASWHPSYARLLDRHGAVLDELRVDPHGRRLAWTQLSEVSPALIAAVIASEDRRFYHHHGVDSLSLAAATISSLRGHRRGASTITMQLTRLLQPPTARSPR